MLFCAVTLIRADHAVLFCLMQDNKCIVFNWNFATALAVVRSVTDAIYLLHMLLQVNVKSLLLA
jgi:hypothetical protein